MTKSLIQCVYKSNSKVYEYYAEGSMDDLVGATHAEVDTRFGTEIVKVVGIRPIAEKKYPYELKAVNKLIYGRGNDV